MGAASRLYDCEVGGQRPFGADSSTSLCASVPATFTTEGGGHCFRLFTSLWWL